MLTVLLAAAAAISVRFMPAHQHASADQKSKSPPILITTIAFGEIDPNGVVPTVNGVPKAGTQNWDIPFPTAALVNGTNYAETFTFDDVSYTGSCNFLVEVTSDKTGETLLKTPASRLDCSPSIVLVSTTTDALSLPKGPATAKATVYYGKKHVSMKVPLVIQ